MVSVFFCFFLCFQNSEKHRETKEKQRETQERRAGRWWLHASKRDVDPETRWASAFFSYMVFLVVFLNFSCSSKLKKTRRNRRKSKERQKAGRKRQASLSTAAGSLNSSSAAFMRASIGRAAPGDHTSFLVLGDSTTSGLILIPGFQSLWGDTG